MKISDWKIGTKLYASFAVVVLVFGITALYEVVQMKKLGNLQNEGAKRAEEALEIGSFEMHFQDLYGMLAEVIINRDFASIQSEFIEDKAVALKEITRVKELADTDKEKEHAAKFDAAYHKYLETLGRVYKDIEEISGATILGDGTVALILDIQKLVQTAEKGEVIK